MAWQTDMVTMLRVLINDLGDVQTFTNLRLEQLLVVSAQLVITDIKFNTTYEAGISDLSITPDPTLTASKDDVFTNFVVMKAACLSDIGTYRTKAILSNLNIKCAQMGISTGNYSDAFKKLLEVGPCAAYEEMKKQYNFGNIKIAKFILTPFISNDFDPKLDLPDYGNDSHRDYH
jgi:hypothetical protein